MVVVVRFQKGYDVAKGTTKTNFLDKIFCDKLNSK